MQRGPQLLVHRGVAELLGTGPTQTAGSAASEALGLVRARAVRLTLAVLAWAAAGTLVLATVGGEVALLPAAFVLGWLNLVGL